MLLPNSPAYYVYFLILVMWKFTVEKGRQVWTYLSPEAQATPEIRDTGGECATNRPTHTKSGIPYNGLPLMTDGVIHSHMLPNGASRPTPLGVIDHKFDPSQIVTPYDTPTPLKDEDVIAVMELSKHLSNPNTGDDMYRRIAIPAEKFRPGSCSKTVAIGALSLNPNVRTVYEDDSEVNYAWNYDHIEAARKGTPREVDDYFSKKWSEEGRKAHDEQVAQGVMDTKPFKGVDIGNITEEDLFTHLEQTGIVGAEYFKHVQAEDGHIASDYGGPMFLMPGLVITCYVTETHLPAQVKLEIIKYILSHQRKDGGWGLHIESKSTMFGTVLNYVTLRLLGCKADLPPVVTASKWIKLNGGAQGIPSWGKFWLSVLNVFPWHGMNSIFPELWILPDTPIHPSRFWCHCRMVYLPMGYMYASKWQFPLNELTRQIREEIYNEPYDQIDFRKFRSYVAETDRFTKEGCILKAANAVMNIYEEYFPFQSFFRKRAMDYIIDYVNAEDEQTNYITIGPVGKFINMLCVFHAYGRNSMQFRLHQSRIQDHLFLAEDGMKCQGYNGPQLWDTAFTVQAFTQLEKGIAAVNNAKRPQRARSLKEQFAYTPLKYFYLHAYKYVEDTQIRDETPNRERWFRQTAQGGWPFSTRDHGWPISDCTAEGLKASIALHDTWLIAPSTVVDPECGRPRYVDVQRMKDAINVMLLMQNECGGWATYELTRSYPFLEKFNPSQVFGGIMIDYPYVECTSSCLQALIKAKHHLGERALGKELSERIDTAVDRAITFIKHIQREDGSWVGSWAICFTYAFWFGTEALYLAGETYASSPHLQKAVQFMLKHQNKDGGWGESFEACVKKVYSPCVDRNIILADHAHMDVSQQEPVSMVINTAWAVLGLLYAGYHKVDRTVIDRAMKFIMSRQLPNGDWPQEGISGVFNGNCMITYTAYRSVFPIWAIGLYLEKCCGDATTSE